MDLGAVVQDILRTVVAYLPNLLIALAILVVGWLAALLITALVRRGLRQTQLDDRVAAWLSGEPTPIEGRSELWIGRAVFWLVMLVVLVAFFQALAVSAITTPLNAVVNELGQYVPRIIGALLLLLVAWIVASVVRIVVVRALRLARFDERLRGVDADAARMPLPHALGDAVFWLVIVVFLPAVLGVLALEGLLAPVQATIDEVLRFIPNVFAAALILIVGWFVARIAQRITTSLLASIGVDRITDRVGLEGAAGRQRLSDLLGLLVYALILLPTLIAALDALGIEALTAPAVNMLNLILAAIPSIFGAAVVLAVAYVIGRIVSGLVASLLAGLGFDGILVRLGIGGAGRSVDRTPSEIVGYAVLVVIMLFATIEGLRLLGFALAAELVAQFLVFAGQVLLGLVIFAIGLFLANLAADMVRGSGARQADLLAVATRVSILALATAMALRQMGLAPEIVTLAFGLILGAIAVASALAFGLGGREIAGEQLRDWLRRTRGARSG